MQTTTTRVARYGFFPLICFMSLLEFAAAAPPIEAFGKVPRMASVELSPSGGLLAWIDNSTEQQKVVIFDLGKRALLRTLDIDRGMKLRGLGWADDETILVDVSVTQQMGDGERDRHEVFRTLAADTNGGGARMLLMSGGDRRWVTRAVLLARRTPKPKTVIMMSWEYSAAAQGREIGSRLSGGRKDSGWVAGLFEVDTRSGKGRLIDQGSQFTEQWVVDKDGQSVARSEWDPERKVYRILRKDGGNWVEIYRREDGHQFWIHGLNREGTALVATGANGERLSKAWTVALDGTGTKVLVEDPNYDVEDVIIDRFSGAPVGTRIGGPDPAVRWLDAKSEARFNALARSFPGRAVTVYGRSEDGKRVLAYVSSPSTVATYYFVDFTKGTADIVGEDYPALVNVTLGEMRAMSYKARDGADIPGYLTLPPGLEAKKLPLVVMPHGGPEARDDLEFDWWAQFLASRGYLVFMPQFRGSTGFGEAHRLAGYQQWGGLMQDDVTDGVKALIEQGLADPRRVCIVGASYGGYAALAGAAFTPDLYACVVSVNGVSDLPNMLAYEAGTSGEESNTVAYWRSHIGSPLDEKVIAKSPARAASNVRAPILLLHGADDTVVPIAQSETMSKALEKLQKPSTFVRLPGEDHWLSRSETRVKVLTEIESFLAKHLASAVAP